jgi:hypothetical protein
MSKEHEELMDIKHKILTEKEIKEIDFKLDYEKSWAAAVSKIYDLQKIIDAAIEELDTYISFCEIDGNAYSICSKALKCMKKAKSILRGENNE